ncbi:MAG: hypothetical protein K2Q18_18285, partial [Bdellovibrionales bacterium]|nr:hypothetical protein [Bdellovibrionales bacterium]
MVISTSTTLLKSKKSSVEIKNIISTPGFFSLPFELSPREHSKSVDNFLGFKILKIERKLIQQFRSFHTHEDRSSKKSHDESTTEGESWIGLNPQVLLTPYSEIYEIFYLIR